MNTNQIDKASQPAAMDANAYFERGIEHGLHEQFDNAIADLTEAIRLSPTNAKFYWQRGNQYLIISHWNEAIADYTEALKLKPDPSGSVGTPSGIPGS